MIKILIHGIPKIRFEMDLKAWFMLLSVMGNLRIQPLVMSYQFGNLRDCYSAVF